MAAIVIFRELRNPSFEEIEKIVEDILKKTGVCSNDIGNYCLLKINAMSREVLPGRNTSPWVLEATLKNLKDNFPSIEFVIGDSDVAGYRQFKQACINWGYTEIAKKYGVEIVNLSEDVYIEKPTDSPHLPIIALPRTVMDVDSIINIPVIKTHVLSGITCCLKNHWGLLPKCRYKYHTRVSETIAEINNQIRKTVLNIADGTVCIEGSGPKTGNPILGSAIFGGVDRVAVDSAVLAFMGFSLKLAPHLILSEKKGIGSLRYEIVGDELRQKDFKPPVIGKDIVSYVERKLRRIPVMGKLLYSQHIAHILGWIGTKYNEIVWFNLYGKRYRSIILNTPYESEFEYLFYKSGLFS